MLSRESGGTIVGMHADALLRYDAQVPRYTSYPTALQFTSTVDAACYAEWLAAIEADEYLSLYLHVPFCDTLCWFCGCHTTAVRRYEPVAGYVEMLAREVDIVAARLSACHRVSHIHFGGGSPNILKGDDWRLILGQLRKRFEVEDSAEIAVEVDPRGLADEQIEVLADIGITRASIGVQDFDQGVQRAINRIQSYELTRRVVDAFRAHGVGAINIDLMYGLPRQTPGGIAETLDKVLLLEPDRLAVFGYAHVPWLKRHQRLIDQRELPGAAQRLAQFETAARHLTEAGYVWIGLDHFAKSEDRLARAWTTGRLRRNFQGYTDDLAGVLMGFGSSAIGTLREGYVQNAPKVSVYKERIAAGQLPVIRGIQWTSDDRLRREIIERLMCDMFVDLPAVCRHHGHNPDAFAEEIAALEPMARDGLVRLDSGRVEITPAGRLAMRVVCAAFDQHLRPGDGRYSRSL